MTTNRPASLLSSQRSLGKVLTHTKTPLPKKHPNLPSLLLYKQQALRKALQSEEVLETEREEMLSVVTNLKDRHRLEAIFEQERIAASHRLLTLSHQLDLRILQTASRSKSVEEN